MTLKKCRNTLKQMYTFVNVCFQTMLQRLRSVFSSPDWSWPRKKTKKICSFFLFCFFTGDFQKENRTKCNLFIENIWFIISYITHLRWQYSQNCVVMWPILKIKDHKDTSTSICKNLHKLNFFQNLRQKIHLCRLTKSLLYYFN